MLGSLWHETLRYNPSYHFMQIFGRVIFRIRLWQLSIRPSQQMLWRFGKRADMEDFWHKRRPQTSHVVWHSSCRTLKTTQHSAVLVSRGLLGFSSRGARDLIYHAAASPSSLCHLTPPYSLFDPGYQTCTGKFQFPQARLCKQTWVGLFCLRTTVTR